MKKDFWFKFYWEDWRADNELMLCSRAAQGFWITLICLMQTTDEPGVLATDGQAWSDDQISELAGGQHVENIRCLDELLARAVARRNSRNAVFSSRVVHEFKVRTARKKAGKSSGISRRKKRNKTRTKLEQNREQTLSNSSSNSSFDSWYLLYPRKDGKAKAVEKFQKAFKEFGLDVLVAGVERYATHVKAHGTEKQFIMLPATWLHGQRWNDELAEPEPNAAKAPSNLLRTKTPSADQVAQNSARLRAGSEHWNKTAADPDKEDSDVRA